MSKYPAYSVYKESGVELIGDIPEHWDSVSLRWISKRYSGGTPDKSNDDYWYEGTIPWLNSGAVNQQVITEPSTHITEEAFKNSSAKWIPENSVLIALAGQGKTKGMAAYTTFPTTCNQSMAAIVFEKYSSKFMFWWLTSQYKNIRGLASDDGRDGLNLEMLGSIPCPIFDEKEQQQIAAFLDNKTAHLDTLIEKKQQMIGLLNEKRIALITQAVTKGLDLSVPMKDSGVEWLGNVPEHWKIWKLKFSVDLVTGKANAKESELQFIGLESIESFTGKIIISDSEFESEGIALYYQANDVLFCKLRPYLAKVYLANKEGLCTSELLVLRGIEVIPNFLKYYLLSQDFINIVNSSTYGSKMPRANWEFIGNLPCLIPPHEKEQQQIADYLDQETTKLDRMVNTIQSAIAKLQEYRTALITAAVTGKIDVRQSTTNELINEV